MSKFLIVLILFQVVNFILLGILLLILKYHLSWWAGQLQVVIGSAISGEISFIVTYFFFESKQVI